MSATERGENTGKLTLKVSKLRDGARQEPLALQRVPPGESCVICLADNAGVPKAKAKGKARPEDKALAVLAGLGPEGADEKEWRDATGSKRTTFDRHRDALLEAERVTRGPDGHFRIAGEPQPAVQGTGR